MYPALSANSSSEPIARNQYSSNRRQPQSVPQVVDYNGLHMQNGEEGNMFEYVDHNPTTGLSLNDLANNDIGMHATSSHYSNPLDVLTDGGRKVKGQPNLTMSRVEMIARKATGSSGNPLKDMKLELTVNQKTLEMERLKAQQLEHQLNHERQNTVKLIN